MFKPSLIALNFLINLSSNIFLLSVLFRLPIKILSCRLFMVCPICEKCAPTGLVLSDALIECI